MATIRDVSLEHAEQLRHLVPELIEFTAYDAEEGGGKFPYAVLVGADDDWAEGRDFGTTADLDVNVRSQFIAVVEEIAADYGETVKFIGRLPPINSEPAAQNSQSGDIDPVETPDGLNVDLGEHGKAILVRSPRDGVLVLHLDGFGTEVDADDGPRLRVHLNDGVIYENPPLSDDHPNDYLDAIREIVALHDAEQLMDPLASYQEALELFSMLDHWISGGKGLPTDWTTP